MRLVYPVPLLWGKKAEISSGFRTSDRPTHDGIDLLFRRSSPGAVALPSYDKNWYMPDRTLPALSIADGVVVQSQDISTGGWVSVYWPEVNLTGQYAHLRDRQVAVGQKVSASQPLGKISYNPIDRNLSHLHFQVRTGNMGDLVDPAPLINNLPAVVNPWTVRLFLVGGMVAAGIALWWRLRSAPTLDS